MRRSVLVFAVAVTAACGSAEDEYGFETGPLMAPGQDCTRCHKSDSEYERAPVWSVAGTVFPSRDAAAGQGVAGVSVRLLSPTGVLLEKLITNQAGNFYTDSSLPDGYRVELEYQGESIAMPCPPPSGGCAKCHSVPPIGFAPGRIYVPQGETDELPPFDCDAWMPIDLTGEP
jgi:hypothetical protein